MKFGTTFSTKCCEDFNLNPEQTLIEILETLQLDSIRLCAYWDRIEKNKDEYDFEWLDRLISIVEKYNTKIYLSIGRKVPRWPEFHEPDWVISKDEEYLNKRLKIFLEKVVNKYNSNNSIIAWQIENEPLYSFGKSKFPISSESLKNEIEYIKSISNKEVLVTDSGEWGNWLETSKYGDLLGVNIYRHCYDETKKRHKRHRFNSKFYGNKYSDLENKPIVTELQAEPWVSTKDTFSNKKIWKKTMSPWKLRQLYKLVKNAKFEEVWFWGCEWWIYLKKNFNDESMLKAGMKIINKN